MYTYKSVSIRGALFLGRCARRNCREAYTFEILFGSAAHEASTRMRPFGGPRARIGRMPVSVCSRVLMVTGTRRRVHGAWRILHVTCSWVDEYAEGFGMCGGCL